MTQHARGQSQSPYTNKDMYNQQYDQNSDSELINLANEAHPVRSKSRPFDWFVCSVFGYLCCPCTGICAMYYAVRANYAMDWERDAEFTQDHTRKAKCLTLTSIIIGSLLVLAIIIFMVVIIVNAEKAARRYMYESDIDRSFNYNN